MKKQLLIISIFFMFVMCNENSKIENERETQKIVVKYNNGNIYCEGTYLVDKEVKTPLYFIGIWKYYYPNGNLSSVSELDDTGEWISHKSYRLNGILKSASITKDNISYSSFFNEDGKLQSETITRVETEINSEGEDEQKTTFKTNKLYYDNNQLKREWYEVDDEYNGLDKMWDEKGNLILSVEYKNGFIINKSDYNL
ncbi:MAG: hypothetical protein Q7U08_02725 [Flavobacteriaceae bacterium]|nr:hypothetical protein [Flavobacteriaceae bacterium]